MTDPTTPTTAPAPIGYAVVQEQEGEYAPPLTRDTFTLSDADHAAWSADDQTALTDSEARGWCRDQAVTLAESRNNRDREISDVVRWHVVALVPVQ